MENLSKSTSNPLKKNDIVYYARIMPSLCIFDVYELKVRTAADTYFVGIDKRDKKAFLLSYMDIDNVVFINRKDAVNKAIMAEKNNKQVASTEKYYEEY